jgi:hypothetical protein
MKDFRKQHRLELAELKKEQDYIKSSGKMMYKFQNEMQIAPGCKVSHIYGSGREVIGRVLFWKGLYHFYVELDNGRKVEIFRGNTLKNLSTDEAGQIEKRVWQIKTRLAQIKEELKDAQFPGILSDCKLNFVEIVNIMPLPELDYRFEQFDLITFVHFQNNHSYQLKVKRGTVTENGYYQIIMVNDEIEEILRSSKRAFLEARLF